MKAIWFEAERQKLWNLSHIPDLEELQKLVGGWIEAAPWRRGHILVVNEEGKLKRMKFGFGWGDSWFCGNGVLLGPPNKNGEFTSVRFDLSEVVDTMVWWQSTEVALGGFGHG